MCSMYMPGGPAHRHDELCRQHTLGSPGSPVLPPLFLCPSLPAIEIRMLKAKNISGAERCSASDKGEILYQVQNFRQSCGAFQQSNFYAFGFVQNSDVFWSFLASYHCIRQLSDISCFSGPSFGRLFKRFPDTWILLCQDPKKRPHVQGRICILPVWMGKNYPDSRII